MTGKPELFVCTNLRMSGASCAGRGSHDLLQALRTNARVKDGTVSVRESVCMGYCDQGPNVKVMGGAFHHGQSADGVEDLLDAAIAARVPKTSDGD